MVRTGSALNTTLVALYVVGDVATTAKLLFFDCYAYTWWNWAIVVPLDFIQGTIWPVYWGIIVPLMKPHGCG